MTRRESKYTLEGTCVYAKTRESKYTLTSFCLFFLRGSCDQEMETGGIYRTGVWSCSYWQCTADVMVVFPIMITLIYGAGPPFLPRTFSAGSSESPQGLNSVETTLLNQTIEVCSNQWSELGRRTWLYKEETIDCTCGIFVLLSRAGSTIWFVISRVFEPNQLSWFFPYYTFFFCVYIPWVQDGDLGALTYFWITGDAQVSQALIRVYVDGEIEPSITYQPAKVRLRTHITEWVFSFLAPFYSLTRWSANIHHRSLSRSTSALTWAQHTFILTEAQRKNEHYDV